MGLRTYQTSRTSLGCLLGVLYRVRCSMRGYTQRGEPPLSRSKDVRDVRGVRKTLIFNDNQFRRCSGRCSGSPPSNLNMAFRIGINCTDRIGWHLILPERSWMGLDAISRLRVYMHSAQEPGNSERTFSAARRRRLSAQFANPMPQST